eukprot:scaffold1410_cov242-Pinguiococcus_pyrenoidosus.AAC.9
MRAPRGRSRGRHESKVLEFPHPPPTGEECYPNSQALKYEVEGVSDAIMNGRLESDEFTWKESMRNAELVEEICGNDAQWRAGRGNTACSGRRDELHARAPLDNAPWKT